MTRHRLPVLLAALLPSTQPLVGLRRGSRQTVGCLAVLLALLVSQAAAVAPQPLAAEVQGYVTAGKVAIARAEVTLQREGSLATWSTMAEADGHYRFDNVEPGRYELHVRAAGFTETMNRALEVRFGATTRADLLLTPLVGGVNLSRSASATKLRFHKKALSPPTSRGPASQPQDVAPPQYTPAIQPAAPPTSYQNKAHPTPAKMAHLGSEAKTAAGGETPSTSPTGSTDGAEEVWFAGLKQSRLEWDVPSELVVNEKHPITVRVYGYEEAPVSGDTLPNATGGAPLKVATQMSAELVSASGEDLDVKSVGAAGQTYVPATGFKDWSWDVTPLHSEKQAKLKLTIDVILNATHSRSFVTYSHPFAIAIATPSSFEDYTEQNLGALIKYWAPGGAGFLAVVGLVEWWRKRRSGRATATLADANRGGD